MIESLTRPILHQVREQLQPQSTTVPGLTLPLLQLLQMCLKFDFNDFNQKLKLI